MLSRPFAGPDATHRGFAPKPRLVADDDSKAESAAQDTGGGFDSPNMREKEETGGLSFSCRRLEVSGLPPFRQARERKGRVARFLEM